MRILPVEGVVVVDLMVDVEVRMVKGVSVWVVPVAGSVENEVVPETVVPVAGCVVITVKVPFELVGIAVLDIWFCVEPKNEEVMLVSIFQWFHLRSYYIKV